MATVQILEVEYEGGKCSAEVPPDFAISSSLQRDFMRINTSNETEVKFWNPAGLLIRMDAIICAQVRNEAVISW